MTTSNLTINVPASADRTDRPDIHLDTRSGEATEAPRLTFNTASIPRGDGILSSARTPWGSPATSINDKTVVQVHGHDTSVASAVHLGLLEKTGDGSYRETGRGLHGAAPPREVTPPTVPLSAPAAMAHAQLQTLPASVLNRAIETVITKGRAAVHNQDLARMSGANEGALSAALSTAVDGLQQQADAALREMGVNPQHFYSVARERWNGELRNAMREHFHRGNPSAYVALVDRYTREVPPDTASSQQVCPTFVDPTTGQEMVIINGQAVSAVAAAKAGLI